MSDFIKTIKLFYSFIFNRKWLFFIFLTVTVISAALSSVVPYFFKLFVDAIESQQYFYLFRLLLALIFIRFMSLLTHMLSFYLGDHVTFSLAIDVRTKVFKHVQDLDFAFHADKSTGYLISAFKRGDGALWNIFHTLHHRFLDILVGFIVMVYFIGQLDFRINIIVIVSFILAIVISRFLIRININARSVHNEEEDKVSAIIVDNMVNFETVKLFSQEEKESYRLQKAFIPWLTTGWKFVNTFRLIDASVGTLINLSVFLILYLGLRLSQYDLLTTGNFVLILGFVSSYYPKLWELVYGFRDIGKNFADLEKYFGLLEFEVEIKDPARPVEIKNVNGEIRYKNVTFTYAEGKKEAVKNIDLRIRQGQSIALVGRSGSGKTTLIKLLMRFYDPDQGAITIDGVKISKMTKSHLRSFMGVVPQEPVLFNNTVGYNIGYGLDSPGDDEIVAAAKIANLHDFINDLPKKYETHVGERGIKLSGGQKQRLAIARMILSDPEIIIFDEATSQLDSENEKLIQEALWKAVKNKTTIIIAHRLATAMRADKIVVMDKGEIVEIGSHLQLLTRKKSLYRHFWDLQVNLDE